MADPGMMPPRCAHNLSPVPSSRPGTGNYRRSRADLLIVVECLLYVYRVGPDYRHRPPHPQRQVGSQVPDLPFVLAHEASVAAMRSDWQPVGAGLGGLPNVDGAGAQE
jgi:hypothetical protein